VKIPGFVAVLLLAAVHVFAEPAPYEPRTFYADFDGDSSPESVLVAFEPNEWLNFRIVLGRDTLDDFGESLHGTAFVVDVDTTDGLLEIAIPEWGPSDDDAVNFVRYTQGELRVVGRLPGRLGDDLLIDGSGVVRTTCRGRILHTWWYPCTFRVFEESGTLAEVPQAFKVMKSAVRLKCDLPLFPSPEHNRPTAMIRSGESATIDLTDDEDWLRIRSQAGTVGWFRISGQYVQFGPTSLLSHEVFDGLDFAD
jgi:hypothetical protein